MLEVLEDHQTLLKRGLGFVNVLPLSLLDSDQARYIGIPAECPVFVHDNYTRYAEYKIGTSPVIYQAGYIVKSPSNLSEGGGIKYTRMDAGDYEFYHPTFSREEGWYAQVVPIGERVQTRERDSFDEKGRAEAAGVVRIVAFCTDDDCMTGELSSGVVYKEKCGGRYLPMCRTSWNSRDKQYYSDARLLFETGDDGSVLFRPTHVVRPKRRV